jgi:hypothetical protein
MDLLMVNSAINLVEAWKEGQAKRKKKSSRLRSLHILKNKLPKTRVSSVSLEKWSGIRVIYSNALSAKMVGNLGAGNSENDCICYIPLILYRLDQRVWMKSSIYGNRDPPPVGFCTIFGAILFFIKTR